jgi:hypothetical protein
MSKKQVIETGEEGIKKIRFILRGKPGSPLVIHQFGEKAKEEIRQKQSKAATKARGARNPEQECEAAKYVDEKGRECAAISSVKKSIISAATAFRDLTKVALRQAIFVSPTLDPSSQLVPIETHDGKMAKGIMREDAVTIGINTRQLAYRPEYIKWQIRVAAEYNSGLVSRAQLLALITQAGWGCGIGEGRPERTSALGWGRFDVIEIEDV